METAKVTVEPTFVMSGSILAGTADHQLVSISTHLEIEAEHDAETIRSLIDQAEKMCFLLDSIERPHEVTRRSSLNGSPL